MTPCWMVVTDVSEQLATSIFRVAQEKKIVSSLRKLPHQIFPKGPKT